MIFVLVNKFIKQRQHPFHDIVINQQTNQAMALERRADSSSETDITSMDFKDTELTLGLPGEPPAVVIRAKSTCMKRGITETVDSKFQSKAYAIDMAESHVPAGRTISPAAKAQMVGWPPVRCIKKNAFESSKYIKVAIDGAPYLRKVDLEMYGSYQELLSALHKMFTCFTIPRYYIGESKLTDVVKGTEYVPTYEDKDGDWMLVGDVPWKMFIESCKRIRVKKSTEAMVGRSRSKKTNLSEMINHDLKQ